MTRFKRGVPMKKLSVHILAFLGITSIYFSTYPSSFNEFFKHTKEKLSSLFGTNTKTQIIQKDIQRTTQKTLIVENHQGAIKIKTDWNQNVISLTAIKKATDENLAKISVLIDTNNSDSIRMKTIFQDDTVKGTVDYTLMVPKQMTVRLKTGKGNIRVKRFDGTIWANTDNGTIEISNVSNKIMATVNESGHIFVEQSKGSIQASTQDGNIQISDAKQSVVASTGNGSIMLQASKVPAAESIYLSATGALHVYLPDGTNAHLKAQATHGKIFSDHYITLASQMTKLDSQSWAQLQRNVEGTLGTGEAEISLSSLNGSIKILSRAVA